MLLQDNCLSIWKKLNWSPTSYHAQKKELHMHLKYERQSF